MRTLLTTKGRVEGNGVAEIASRFAAARSEGFWLDIEAPDEDDLRLLADTLKVHPLTIEDIQHQGQRPKVDDYPDYSFAVIVNAEWRENDVVFHEHQLLVGTDHLISIHTAPAPALTALQDRVAKSPELAEGQPAFLTYLVIDALVDATFPTLEKLDDAVDQLEDEIIAKPTSDALRRISDLKHSVTELRRSLGAQRDVFQRLTTHGVQLQERDMTLYYRDVYDHIVRQYETVDSLRDLLTSAMDVYLSTVSNLLNSTTKTLTVIASLFLPLSFLSGFYGMNFAYLTGVLETPDLAFAFGLGTMAIATGIQLYLFRRRGWI